MLTSYASRKSSAAGTCGCWSGGCARLGRRAFGRPVRPWRPGYVLAAAVSGAAFRRFGLPPGLPGFPGVTVPGEAERRAGNPVARPGLCMVNTHPVANCDGDWSETGRFYPLHRAQFAVLAEVVNAARPRAVVCGDFNIDRDSSLFGGFMRRRAGRRVRGHLPGYVPRRISPGGRDAALHRFHPDRRRGQGGSAALIFAEKEPLGYVSDHIGLRARLSLTASTTGRGHLARDHEAASRG